MHSMYSLSSRNLQQHRSRTVLSALAVALGAAMIVAADMVSASILNSMAGSEDVQTFMTGLLDQLDSILTLVGVGITLAAGFLIFNAFAMSVTQRRRQIGSLRALGMTRRQTLRLVLVEALTVGSLGTVLGLIAGPFLGKGTIALMKALLGKGLFVFSASGTSLSSLLLATAMGVSVTLLSALIPAWQATRVSPLAALHQTTTSANLKPTNLKSLLLGLLITAVLAVYLAVALPGEWVQHPWDTILTTSFGLIWLVGLALILPAFIGGTGQHLRRPLTRLGGATGRLIADNVQRGRRRVTLTILTLAVALTMIVGMTGFITFMVDELMGPNLTGIERLRAWIIAPFDISAGMSAYSAMELPRKNCAICENSVGRNAIPLYVGCGFTALWIPLSFPPSWSRKSPGLWRDGRGSWTSGVSQLCRNSPSLAPVTSPSSPTPMTCSNPATCSSPSPKATGKPLCPSWRRAAASWSHHWWQAETASRSERRSI